MIQVNDPYSSMLETMKNEGAKLNPPTLTIGTVISVNPLIISTGDLQLNKSNILISERLIDYKQNISISCPTVSGSVVASDHTAQLKDISIEKQEMKFWCILKEGDLLALIPIQDEQIYVVLEKVVRIP